MRLPAPPGLSRACALGLFALLGVDALAQVPPPPRLEPIPEPPPRPIGVEGDTSGERGVRISPGSPQRAEETVVDGKRAIHVTNEDGTEYYIVEDQGDGTVTGQNPGDTRVRVPRWVILRF